MKLDKVKQELIEVGLITLYFFTCFAIFMVIKKLLLIQYHISFYGWATAAIGALAMGKVVFLVDKLPIRSWLIQLKPIYEISIKALIYTVIVFTVSVLEKTAHYYFGESEPESWSSQLFGDGKNALLLAHSIYIYLCFAVFYFFQFLDHSFGREHWFGKMLSKRD